MNDHLRDGAGILIVDDDPSSAEALAALLREEGHHATVAASGREATAALAGGACGLLILDPSLRDCTGPHLLRYADDLGVSTIVTTSDPAFDPVRTHDPIRWFLYKPIRLPTLLSLVAHALNPPPQA